MDDKAYRQWVEAYVKAWNTNDPSDIGRLFAPDAVYLTEPYARPWQGREEIVTQWLEAKDEPEDTEFAYELIAATDAIGIVKGNTLYKSTGRKYSNLWEIRLDDHGACKEFVEWWMKQEPSAAQD
ncbi:MAG: SgcJ/EcaC family oxidoreductase [Actinomycetota bacterium]